MIAKKNKRYDLERKRVFFFQAGILIMGSLTLAAFTYTSPVESVKTIKYADAVPLEFEIEEMVIPEPEIIIPQVPSPDDNQSSSDLQQTTNPGIVDERSIHTGNVPTNVLPHIGVPNLGNHGITKITGDEAIETNVKYDAAYIGGYTEMLSFIQKHVKYPEMARELGIQGKVYVTFVVEKNGDVSNVEIKRGVDKDLDREAMRVVKSFPKWKPGEQNYGAVRTRVVLPINFELK